MKSGSGLQLRETGTTVRPRDGRRQVQDGPYADSKERMGGCFILDVPDLDVALDWAARCPAESDGSVDPPGHGHAAEVRPAWTVRANPRRRWRAVADAYATAVGLAEDPAIKT